MPFCNCYGIGLFCLYMFFCIFYSLLLHWSWSWSLLAHTFLFELLQAWIHFLNHDNSCLNTKRKMKTFTHIYIFLGQIHNVCARRSLDVSAILTKIQRALIPENGHCFAYQHSESSSLFFNNKLPCPLFFTVYTFKLVCCCFFVWVFSV